MARHAPELVAGMDRNTHSLPSVTRNSGGFVEKTRTWQALPINLGTAVGDSLGLDE
jgi:hypothetical protein